MIQRATLLAVAVWASFGLAQTAVSNVPTDPPALDRPASEPSAVVPENSYTVRAGDTLYRISKLVGVGVEDLMTLNNLESTTVEVGQLLLLPKPAPVGAAAADFGLARPGAPAPVRGPSAWKLSPPEPTASGFSSRGQPVLRGASTNSGILPQAYLGSLTFSRQTYNNCGPAAVSSVLGYYGFRVDQEELRRVLRPGGGYMSAGVIDPFVRKYGLKATTFKNGNLSAVKRLVNSGIPVIVLQWLDRPGHIPHFRVVRGYDDKTGLVWVADSMIAEAAYVTYRDFDALWNTQGRLMIPVYPPPYEAQVMNLVGL